MLNESFLSHHCVRNEAVVCSIAGVYISAGLWSGYSFMSSVGMF